MEIIWQKDAGNNLEKKETLGVYFLPANLNVFEEYVVWNIYNMITKMEMRSGL